ncbi:MAG: ferredoxin reductase family protein [Chloroflexota bacterium]
MLEVDSPYPVAQYDSGRPTTLRGRGFHTAYFWWGPLVVLANAAIIIWLWVHDGQVTGIHNTAGLFQSLGRITGLLGAYLLLIQLLFFARLPWFVRHVGLDRLVLWHRLNGKTCLILILAHIILITVGYSQFDHISLMAEVRSILGTYPYMVRASIGTGLLILVVVTSLVIVRRHLRYEPWYFVHLTAYFAVLLGWYHQIPTGNEFVVNATAATYWTALYLVTLALVVLFRVLRPLFRAFRYQLKVAEVTHESPNVFSLHITGRHLDALHARAGQFFGLRFLTPRLMWQLHPFSLSESPNGRSLRITIKISGDFTRTISTVKPGTRILAEGPFGHLTDAVRRRAGVALIAGGIGVTPMRALLEGMPGDVVLIYRVAREDEILFRDEFDALERNRGVRVHFVTGDHRAPGNERLMTTEHLCELVPDLEARDVYLCGPPTMMDAIERSVEAAGVPPAYIHTERFAV